jgi:hypothetical protein
VGCYAITGSDAGGYQYLPVEMAARTEAVSASFGKQRFVPN